MQAAPPDLEKTERQASRRGRGPSPAKTAATRAALVEAATAIFLERGFEATRMSDVALRAGLAKGTIYLHFTDKPDLFAAILRDLAFHARGGRAVPRPRLHEPTAAFLRRTMLPVLKEVQASGRGRVVLLVASEGARFPELARLYRQIAIDPMLRFVRLCAARAERRGELPEPILSHQPVLLMAPIVITTLWNQIFAPDNPTDVAALFDSYLDLLFRTDPA